MNKIKFLFIITSILIVQISYSQNSDFTKYAIALSEITTFADNKGFKEEVNINNSSKDIKWISGEDGYNYTENLDAIIVFGYKILYASDDNLILGVYYDSEGTATYSYLFNVTISDTKLKLNEVIAGGDRCHNAVILDKLNVDKDVMSFSTLITPNKLISWFSESSKVLNLDDCMVCCLGFANFKYDFEKQFKKFESVRIIEEALQENSLIKKTYLDFVKEEPLKLSLLLNEDELKDFIKAFQEK
jgi:hypothetical protein